MMSLVEYARGDGSGRGGLAGEMMTPSEFDRMAGPLSFNQIGVSVSVCLAGEGRGEFEGLRERLRERGEGVMEELGEIHRRHLVNYGEWVFGQFRERLLEEFEDGESAAVFLFGEMERFCEKADEWDIGDESFVSKLTKTLGRMKELREIEGATAAGSSARGSKSL